jgi:hypothetical protein
MDIVYDLLKKEYNNNNVDCHVKKGKTFNLLWHKQCPEEIFLTVFDFKVRSMIIIHIDRKQYSKSLPLKSTSEAFNFSYLFDYLISV